MTRTGVSGASNRGRHSDAEIDTLIEDALATVDDEARLGLLQKATELAIGRNQGIIPTHYQVNTWAGRTGTVLHGPGRMNAPLPWA